MYTSTIEMNVTVQHKFKVGDTINHHSARIRSARRLEVLGVVATLQGSRYELRGVEDDNHQQLSGRTARCGVGFIDDNYELVPYKPKFKAGDTITCLPSLAYSHLNRTIVWVNVETSTYGLSSPYTDKTPAEERSCSEVDERYTLVPVFMERYMPVCLDGYVGLAYETEHLARKNYTPITIGILHLRTDGTTEMLPV